MAAKVTITAPNTNFIGRRSGIAFIDGVASFDVSDDASEDEVVALGSKLTWFSNRGYSVDVDGDVPHADLYDEDDSTGSGDDGNEPFERPADNASTDDWKAFADQENVAYPPDVKRDELIVLVDDAAA